MMTIPHSEVYELRDSIMFHFDNHNGEHQMTSRNSVIISGKRWFFFD